MTNSNVLTERTTVDRLPLSSGLFTDLYELTMLQAYVEESMLENAVFSLFVRRLPPSRNFLIACGLETALQALEALRFSKSDIEYLQTLGQFSDRFLDWLEDFRFTGNVRAVPEGTPVFPDEPLLEVSGTLPEAQFVETLIMNHVHLQTLLASKAYRVVRAAAGRPVIDFAARRMHGAEAAINGARSFFVAGVHGTSNVLAGKRYGIPVSGTMAHSYIQAHDDEADAFRAFSDLYPTTVLLVDTYDTLAGVRKVVDLARTLGSAFRVSAIRLDSGDLEDLARKSRQILDSAGLANVEIFASGSLDENEIESLLTAGAPIDGFGVGTRMGISSDAPSLDIAYKLSEYAGEGRLKLSPGKPVLPGPKQIYRRTESNRFAGDVIGRIDEDLEGEPLLTEVMREGRILASGARDLSAIRSYAADQIERLPEMTQRLGRADPPYPVDVSDKLRSLHKKVADNASNKQAKDAS